MRCLESKYSGNQHLLSTNQARKAVKKAMEDGSHSWEWTHKKTNGVEFATTVLSTKFKWGNRDLLQGTIRDITERKQSEKELKESEEKYRELAQSSNSIIMKLDRDCNVTFFNKYAQKFFGFSEDEIIGRSAIGTIIPKFESTGRNLEILIEKLFDNPEAFADNENENICKNGERVWIAWRNKSTYDGDGKLSSLLCTGYDITERKRAQAALKESEEKVTKAFHTSPVIMGISDLNTGEYTEVNQIFYDKLGFTTKEVIGVNAANVIRMDGKFRKRIVAKLQKQGSVLNEETIIYNKNGAALTVLLSAEIIELKNKKYIFTSALDISERKKVENALAKAHDELENKVKKRTSELEIMNQELRKSQYLLRRIIDSIEGEVFVKDTNGKYQLVNKSFGKSFGVETNSVLGKDDFFISPPEVAAQLQERDKRIMASKIAEKAEESGIVKGKLLTYLSHKAPLINENGEVFGICGIAFDITQQKAIEEELRMSKEEAEKANKAKSDFLSTMSHELRTPLNAILGYSQLFQRDSKLNNQQREDIKIINHSGKHLLDLINDILELSKIESGKNKLTENDFKLTNIASMLKNSFSLRAKEKGLKLNINFDPDTPEYIKTDEGKFRQILFNLISNAVKFTESGNIQVGIKSNVDTTKKTYLEVIVKDTGPGISANEIDKLFYAFEQTSVGEQKKEGTGLGLAISRKYAQMLGGDLTVDSKLGAGSTFTVKIAVEVLEQEQISRLTSEMTERKVLKIKSDEKLYKILVVDDDLGSRDLLKRLLDLVGFQVKTAENGKEGFNHFLSWQPDLILMDMRMPVMDGYETTCRIKNSNAETIPPIIALTASAFKEDRTQILAAGCDDIHRKPFQEYMLLESIGNLLGIKFDYENKSDHSTDQLYQKNETWNLTPASFLHLSSELRMELKTCALTLNQPKMMEMVNKIDDPNQEDLVIKMKELINDYEYEKIIKLISEQD
jgi:two-component system, sensor histidine kinase and response regulator